MTDLPDWTKRGGYFRPHFRANDIPKPWTDLTGYWKREEMVPYGKASDEYRKEYFRCPECKESLTLGEEEYRFECLPCHLVFGWSFGGLNERRSEQRYIPDEN